tara:strand:- start:1862 stop:2593 length:732 start_codon:yes stop_codon:yes gene_type:complete
MRETDFTEYQFRASSLGLIMTNPRSKKETLSVTTKSFLQELHKEALFGYTNDIQTLEMKKGILVEDDAIDLVSELHGRDLENRYVKNVNRYWNDYIQGEPDVYRKDECLMDIKNSFTMKTFPMYYTGDLLSYNKDYYWQLQGYMWLTDMKKATLVRCLMNTPEDIVEGVRFRRARELGVIDLPLEEEEKIIRDHTFEHHPPQLRVVEIPVEYNEEHIEQLKERIAHCREYLNFLSDHISNKLI